MSVFNVGGAGGTMQIEAHGERPAPGNTRFQRAERATRPLWLWAALLGSALVACGSARDGADAGTTPAAPAPAASVSSHAGVSPSEAAGVAARPTPAPSGGVARSSGALRDSEVGALFVAISEKGGHFPSDNYVSNESSFLHVDGILRDPKRRTPSGGAGAYLGVGPDQNFTYLGRLDPQLAFVVDIRRENALLHLVYKVLFETSESRGAFVAGLFSRDAAGAPGAGATVEELLAFAEKAPHQAANEARLIAATIARQKALGIPSEPDDEKAIRDAVHAFGTQGPAIRYKMEGSSRKYPSLFDLAKEKTDAGERASFLADETTFRTVQRLERENRLIPVVGNLAGEKAVRAVGEALRQRHTSLAVVYTSNVEQYVFAPADWKAWRENLASLPLAENAILLRVYFDQGKHHPLERPGHRTVSLAHDAARFLDRAQKPGYKSWYEVATDDALLVR
jgi:hypothetical protein